MTNNGKLYVATMSPNRSYPGASIASFYCDRCEKYHTHGLPDGDDTTFANEDRVAHCSVRSGGYDHYTLHDKVDAPIMRLSTLDAKTIIYHCQQCSDMLKIHRKPETGKDYGFLAIAKENRDLAIRDEDVEAEWSILCTKCMGKSERAGIVFGHKFSLKNLRSLPLAMELVAEIATAQSWGDWVTRSNLLKLYSAVLDPANWPLAVAK